ncbi:VOC family protein [Nocardioides sp. B-3]|uniref:VOC family protein n=1 Tax=Nocardioides sp. B-3 TaxID=2895565 RepID=UPI002152443C|nr:VOC family protein [Nocardioides sp. B-3]UUZ59946.1 hypothetical protein LP418_02620 [Nocardioides sp. B-3]
MTAPDQYASVRYLVDDVDAAVEFYTTHLGFELLSHPAPPFADVVRGPLRLLLSGTASLGSTRDPGRPDVGWPQPHPPGRRRLRRARRPSQGRRPFLRQRRGLRTGWAAGPGHRPRRQPGWSCSEPAT